MPDAPLVEARRDPEKKVEWAVTKLARLTKEKTLAPKVLEVESSEPEKTLALEVLQVESSEPITDAPLTFLKWTQTCATPKIHTIVL
jgi:hypothetical protein